MDARIEIRRVTMDTARALYETCLKKDFPPEEVKPFAVIERMWNKDSYYVYVFYEQTDKDAVEAAEDNLGGLCAYAFLLADNQKRTLLLDYFAVCQSKRGEGYGSHVLSLLRGTCRADWNALLIEVEDDEMTDIDEQTRTTRRRRISFYSAAGCLMTTVRSFLWDVNYRIMVLPLRDEHAEAYAAEKLCALYEGMYEKRELQKHFAILSQ